MIKLIENYIEDTDNTSWYNKYKEVLLYLFFGGCTTLLNIIAFALLIRVIHINPTFDTYISNSIAWTISVIFAYVTNKLFVFESKGKTKKENVKESLSFLICRLLSLVFDMGFMYLLIDILSVNEIVSKVISNVLVVIINYVFSKVLIFKK